MTAPLAATETAALRRVRLMFLLVLFISTLCVATAVSFYLQDDEEDRLNAQFDSFASKLVDAINESRSRTLGTLGSMIFDVEAYVDNNDLEWPFVTLPGFVERAQKAMGLSAALQIGFHYVVRHNQTEEWLKYASENNQWVRTEQHTFPGTRTNRFSFAGPRCAS